MEFEQLFTGASTNISSSSKLVNGVHSLKVTISGTASVVLENSTDEEATWDAFTDTNLTFTATGEYNFEWVGPVRLTISGASGASVDAWISDQAWKTKRIVGHG